MKVEQITTRGLAPSEILQYIPQQDPFRFIDQIIYANEQEICGIYTFKANEFFYAGHFPSKAITPGVILLESMSQIGVVAFGIYLLSIYKPDEQIKNWLTMFTDAQVEFLRSVLPGTCITVVAKKIFWKKMKLKAAITMLDPHQNIVATATVAGMGVKI